MKHLALAMLMIPALSHAGDYSAQRATVDGIEVIRLKDSVQKIEVSIAPSLGNNAYEMKINGRESRGVPGEAGPDGQSPPFPLGEPDRRRCLLG
jgi:hypothetical protein